MLVTLPCVMLLLDFWPLQRIRQADLRVSTGARLIRLAVEKWPFFVLTLASCLVTILAQRAEAIAPLTKYSLGLRLENAVTAYAGYLYKTFWPNKLAVFYPLLQPAWTAVALASTVLLAVSALVWWRAKPQPWLAIGWLWYLGTLVPVIGLLQVGDQALADRTWRTTSSLRTGGWSQRPSWYWRPVWPKPSNNCATGGAVNPCLPAPWS